MNTLFFDSRRNQWIMTIIAILSMNVTFQTYGIFIIGTVVVTFYLYILNHGNVDNLFSNVIFMVLLVSAGQAIVFESFNWYNFGGVFLIFLMPYFIYGNNGLTFFRIYVRLMYIFCVISLVFWAIQNLIPGSDILLSKISEVLALDPGSNESLIIYNVEHSKSALGLYKNPGFLAEGGVFATLIIPALYFDNIRKINFFSRESLVFVFTLLTTASTAGYSALIFFLIMVMWEYRKRSISFFLIPLMVFSIYYAVVELPFMYTKVTKMYNDEMNVYEDNSRATRKGRFLSARVDIDLIMEYPLFGKGIYMESRYLTDEEREIGYSNSYMGVIGLASRYGLILWAVYFYFFFAFIRRYFYIQNPSPQGGLKIFKLCFTLSVLMVSMGQNPFPSPIYLVMVYCGYYLTRPQLNLRKLAISENKYNHAQL
ncbi:MAG: hypothetical protein RL609_274 [Bacteroidota bacterium]|jgi:hypothetical protein